MVPILVTEGMLLYSTSSRDETQVATRLHYLEINKIVSTCLFMGVPQLFLDILHW